MPERVHTLFSDDEQSPSAAQPPPKKTHKKSEISRTTLSKRKASETFHHPDHGTIHQPTKSGLLPSRNGPSKIDNFHDQDHDWSHDDSGPKERHTNGHIPPSPGSRSADTEQKGKLKRRAAELLETRRLLPIFPYAEEIRATLRPPTSEVLLLVGETGSGKSTQVPQFLVNEPWCRKKSVLLPQSNGGKSTRESIGGCIAITEPRRVAAISLARRVAEERGTPLGNSSPASQVGYSVRFDTSTSPSTRIKFVTEGMLLQEMLRDPWLKEYSAVIVDEVHERGVNVDLVLGFLKRMQQSKYEGRGGIGLKVVVMSATADMEQIQAFFSTNSLSQEATQEQSKVLDEEWSGFPDSDGQSSPRVNGKKSGQPPNSSSVSICHIAGRQYPVRITYTTTVIPDILDAAFQHIIHIHEHEPLPGDILVFLTGQETVETLESLCKAYAEKLVKSPSNIPKLHVLPLFAALPQHAQQRIFLPPPPRTRKVIISTNIAETSLTVPGIRHVLDCGKHKIKQFRPRLNLDTLLVKTISKSAAKQRAGRAGREGPGTCHRLYPEVEYLQFAETNEPEILRCDLTQLVLCLKARGVDNITRFPFLTPPPAKPLETALLSLLQLSALDPASGTITPLGQQLAHLPLPPSLARVLLASTTPALSCLLECIDIVSALSVPNLFLNMPNHDDKDSEEDPSLSPRHALLHPTSDHLTLLNTVQSYLATPTTDRKSFCTKHHLSHRALQSILDIRKQLSNHMKQHLQPPSTPPNASTSTEELNKRILSAILTAFPTHTARLMPDGGYQTLLSGQKIAIHPSSVLFRRQNRGKGEVILYHEFVYTTKGYARGCSVVDVGDVERALKGEV